MSIRPYSLQGAFTTLFGSENIGIDLGTASVLVYRKGKGIVLREPSVVAVDRATGRILEVGEEARKMLGRTPANIVAVRPLRDGVISDYDLTERMLRYFLRRVVGRHLLMKPRVVVCVPSGVTEVEKRSVVEATLDAGAKETLLIEEPIAAIMGAGVDILQPRGCMVVDVGGGTTDIAVISMGSAVVSDSVKMAGDRFDESIIRYMRKRHNLLIGERTAEKLKIQIGGAKLPPAPIYEEVTGRNLVTGLPKTISVSSTDIVEAMQEPVQAIVDATHAVLERTPPELAGDIFDSGIVMTGGGSLLYGLAETISERTHVPCRVAEDAVSCVALGTGIALENMSKYGNDVVFGYRRGGAYNKL